MEFSGSYSSDHCYGLNLSQSTNQLIRRRGLMNRINSKRRHRHSPLMSDPARWLILLSATFVLISHLGGCLQLLDQYSVSGESVPLTIVSSSSIQQQFETTSGGVDAGSSSNKLFNYTSSHNSGPLYAYSTTINQNQNKHQVYPQARSFSNSHYQPPIVMMATRRHQRQENSIDEELNQSGSGQLMSTHQPMMARPISSNQMTNNQHTQTQQQQTPTHIKSKLKEQQLNKLQKYLNEEQLRLVRENPGSLSAVARALKMTILECQHQMRQEQWDCPIYGYSAKPVDVFGKLMSRSFRETSFIHSLLSAALTHSIARACTESSIQTCGRKPIRDGGFTEDIEFGQVFSERFMKPYPVESSTQQHQQHQLQQEATGSGGHAIELLASSNYSYQLQQHLNAEPSKSSYATINSLNSLNSAQESTSNHIQVQQTDQTGSMALASRQSPTTNNGNQIQQTKSINEHQFNTIVSTAHTTNLISSNSYANSRRQNEMKIREVIDAHNDQLGRLLVLNNMRRACKCHGVSGACTAHTCWLQLPPFREVANQLHEKFDQAIQVQSYFLSRPSTLNSAVQNSKSAYGLSSSARKSNKKRSSSSAHFSAELAATQSNQISVNAIGSQRYPSAAATLGGANLRPAPSVNGQAVSPAAGLESNSGAHHGGLSSQAWNASSLTLSGQTRSTTNPNNNNYHQQVPSNSRPSKRHTTINENSANELTANLSNNGVACNRESSSTGADCRNNTTLSSIKDDDQQSNNINYHHHQGNSMANNNINYALANNLTQSMSTIGPGRMQTLHQNVRRPVARSISMETQRNLHQALPSKLDLIYQLQSPDFCKPSETYMIKGTEGRICSPNARAPDRCDRLCCGRGYKTDVREEKYNCECIFKFCCELDCKTCTRRKYIHKCL